MNASAFLPPMRYALFLPHRGTYLRQMDMRARCFRFTSEKTNACVLPEPEARLVGTQLAQTAQTPVELRPWEDKPCR
jgi:hypothetical protein